ncbi:MAG: cob(I)yrinic acid a,c-diamide adenosyltransferase [Acetobacteraceae bacterium]
MARRDSSGPVRIDRVVTRGGDGGMTSLGDGSRVGKESLRIEAIGAVDETNAAIGMIRSVLGGRTPDAALAQRQNELFDLGADLAVPGEGGSRLRMTDAAVSRLEEEIAAMNAALPALTSFIMPGGSPGSAAAHLARTIARRAEREVIRLAAVEHVTPASRRYLNRLSDYLFVLARALDDTGAGVWVPGGAATPSSPPETHL